MKKTITLLMLLLVITCVPAHPQEKKKLTIDTLLTMKRISDVGIAPDGKQVVCTISMASLKENTYHSSIWLINPDGTMAQFTTGKGRDCGPQWSPDGSEIAFISDRDGKNQIWLINTSGGEANKLTDISTGASGALWSPDGSKIAFTSSVHYECKDEEANKNKVEAEKNKKVKARVYDSLLYRHWDHYRNDKRSHLFIISRKGGAAMDLTPLSPYDVPPLALGGKRDYAFSPDSKEICYVTNTDSPLTLSTNNDLFIVPVDGGEPRRITTNQANDNQPLYSPDGRYIAYRAQKTPRYESDRYCLMLYDRSSGTTRPLTEGFDRSVDEVLWAPDSSRLYFTAEDKGFMPLFTVRAGGGGVTQLMEKSYNHTFSLSADGRRMAFVRESSCSPPQVYTADGQGKSPRQITHMNRENLAGITMRSAEEFTFQGAEGTAVHGFMIKPPDFSEGKKYPLILMIHGGPQQMWSDSFGTSWNPQFLAAQGYVAVKINPRGSDGYGQKFKDEINRNWGGRPYEDLMKGIDYLTSHYPFIDRDKMAACGASYGGYMVNWIAGHTDLFRCLISVAGAYNLTGKFGATDELWFPEWEFGGTPWTAKEQYEMWSPHNFAQNFKTPVLVIHGAYDYRVPDTEAMAMFNALQRQGVPSRFLYYPDEGHWISKPLNLELYLTTIKDWLARWLTK